jgi:uncharacterized protein (TIGR02145 family)
MIEPAGKDQIFIGKLSEIILANLENENFGVKELADQSGNSQYILSQRIHSITGKTINQFIRETRLQKALEMLQNEEVTASEVAYKVGFSSPTYFNTCFHDFFGFPPGTVKETVSGNNKEINSIRVPARKEHKKGISKTLIIVSSCILSVALIAFLVLNIVIKNSSFYPVLLIKNLGKSFIHKKGDFNNVTDIDGNVYSTVTIGTQVWMAEDLKTTHYTDGTPIPYVTDNPEIVNLKSGAYCWFNNEESNKTIYGAVYNWYATADKLCPVGWHVSTYSDWATLIDYCGGWELAGGKLKEAGAIHWDAPNTGATNETGFTALPAGGHGTSTGWWCPPRFGYLISLGNNRTWVYLTECHACRVNYVRCVRD